MNADRSGNWVASLGGLCWIAVAFRVVGSVATTLVGLRLRLMESNPVARSVLAAGGPVAMVALKTGPSASASPAGRFFPGRTR